MKKETVLDFISKLPDEFSIEEVIESLIVVEKIDQGLQQVKEGEINSENQAKLNIKNI